MYDYLLLRLLRGCLLVSGISGIVMKQILQERLTLSRVYVCTGFQKMPFNKDLNVLFTMHKRLFDSLGVKLSV